MTTLAAGKFKAQCLAIIDNVAQTHEPIIITKHGKPLVKVVPLDNDKTKYDKPLKGTVMFVGDIISPIDEEWTASK